MAATLPPSFRRRPDSFGGAPLRYPIGERLKLPAFPAGYPV
jgi:hypothetical protein